MAQATIAQVGFDLVERQVGQAVAVERRVKDQVDGVEDERAVDPHAGFPSVVDETPAVERA